ncbi:DUF362 domain-containing protein [Fibrobacterota bacterium]
MAKVAQVEFVDYESSVTMALDEISAGDRLPDDRLIIIKPNLTNADKPPVTTNIKMVESVYRYCRSRTNSEIAIGEGCGSGTTSDAFRANGYEEFAGRENIRLLDFNREKAVRLKRSDALQLKEFYVPEIVIDAFVISVPVLKDHCFTVTTCAMKNMFGIAPAPYYSGSWNKSQLHSPSTHRSVFDVCLYKKPDLSVVDASIALTGMHLSGTEKKLGVILAGFDPVAVDAAGSELLGHNPRDIEYLTLADGVLGNIEYE